MQHLSHQQLADLQDLPEQAPQFISPMQCTPVAELPDDASQWLYELKLDGWRCIAVKDGPQATLYSQYGHNLDARFPAIRTALAKLEVPCILDGELVAVDPEGHPVFQELQNYRSSTCPIYYYVFDLLMLNRRGISRLPLEQRKALLEPVAKAFLDPIRLATPFEGPLGPLIAEIRRRHLEGLVAKRRTSPYRPGIRSANWLKHRFTRVQPFVVGGYVPGKGADFRLLVGTLRNGRLEYVESIRNGFAGNVRAILSAGLQPLQQPQCPFTNLPERGSGPYVLTREKMAACIWVAPRLRAEVELLNWTTGGHLRHAAFRRLLPEVGEESVA